MGATESSVDAFFEKLAASWKANDGADFAGHFTEDGSLINPFGQRADGRAALTAMYSDYFGGMLAGTTTSISLTHSRPVGADHLLTEGEQNIYAPTGETILALHAINLLQRDGESWKLVDSRPYEFSQLPG